MNKIYPICVIGGGSAGVMAVLRTVLNNDETLFFPGTKKDRKKSREKWVKKVENMPGHLEYTRGIQEPNLESLNWLAEGVFKKKFHWKKDLGVTSLVKTGDVFKVTDSEDQVYECKHVILCTGVTDVQPHIQESIRDILPFANKQTADYCLRCDGHHVFDKELAIIGETNSTAWVAIMLYERYRNTTVNILTNGKKVEFSDETSKLLEAYKIEVHDEEIMQILGDVRSGSLDGFVLSEGKNISAEICFISLGMIVYNELAIAAGAEVDQRGFVLTNPKGETNIDGLYIAGDLRAGLKKQIYTAWDSAVDAADDINAKIRRENRKKVLELN